ncbi:c-type cytochrome [Halomonas sp. ANAO-440]|uniref:c-type cytochrome n=1 Tax=Halomonas sp. ANAO-440 TaxID=2861360 RepID=UPI001CAA55B0|nr:c-type cytochrome [Halomonas sp. ANAO-440]MBZ0330942.1 c-type cytochrome [Halomonas sp. ANAO-440]
MTQKYAVMIVATLVALLSQAAWSGDPPPQALAGDPERGAEMAKLCTSCHGHQGRSVTSRYPSIAGMEEGRFIDGMKALRAGDKGHLMANMTRGLNDQDIADLAAHYAQLEPTPWDQSNAESDP